MKTRDHILKPFSIACVSLLALGSGVAPKADASQPQVQAVLDSLEHKLTWLDYRIGLEEWDSLTTGESDSLEFFRNLYLEVLGDGETYQALRNRRSALESDFDQRRYDLLYPLLVRTQINLSTTVRQVYDSLADFYSRPWCRLDGRTISIEEARHLSATARRGVDRETAYRAMSDPGELTRQLAARLYRLRNQAARRMGYNDYFSLSAGLVNVEVEEYRHFIDQVDSLTRREYERTLRDLRASMSGDEFEVWDWVDRFRNVREEIDPLLPADGQVTLLDTSLEGLGFDLDNMPIYWRISPEPADAADTRVITVDAPHDIRLVVTLAGGFTGYQELVRAVGDAVNSAESARDSELLARQVHPVWTCAVARLFELFTLDPDWLGQSVGAPPGLQTRVIRAAHAIELLHLRLLLTDARFEYEAYRNADRNLNSLYWDLFVQYTGLPRHDDLAPWAANPDFLSRPLDAYYRLLGRCVAAQNLAYLLNHYGRIHGQTEVGSFLVHNYLRHGARYEWRDLLERATGEPLSIRYLISR